MLHSSRQTGRTTAMLQRAIQLANYGKRISIRAATEQHAEYLRRRLQFMTTPEVCQQITVIRSGQRIVGFSGIVMVDHYAVELKLQDLARRLEEITNEVKELSDSIT